MSSNSLTKWRNERSRSLDEIQAAHATVGGTARGRRYATLQINYAYAAILSSQFQGFCRDLHSESIDYIVAKVPLSYQAFMRVEFVWNRSLDKGNPNPGNIGNDFNRLGILFWPNVLALDARNDRRREMLGKAIDWRNAIAHQDFSKVGGDPTLHLTQVRAWRRSFGALADHFDNAMRDHLTLLLGHAPW